MRSITKDIQKLSFYGKTKTEVQFLLSNYQCVQENKLFYCILGETWYGKRTIIKIVFENNKVVEKYIKTEYGKLSFT